MKAGAGMQPRLRCHPPAHPPGQLATCPAGMGALGAGPRPPLIPGGAASVGKGRKGTWEQGASDRQEPLVLP